MNCPECNLPMEKVGESHTTYSHQRKPGAEYERTLYWCKPHDIWISIERPKVPASTNS